MKSFDKHFVDDTATVREPVHGENDLVKVTGNTSIKTFDEKVFDKVATGSGFMPRVQLMTSASEKCKSGEFPINHFALIRDQNFVDLGGEMEAVVLSWRPKAMEIGEAVITVYDTDDAEFSRIQEKAGEANSGCMYGPEFLLWIPNQGYATFFCGSKTTRRESPLIRDRIGKGVRLKPKKIETAKYTWYGVEASPAASIAGPMPEEGEMGTKITAFVNPPKSEVEAATPDGRER